MLALGLDFGTTSVSVAALATDGRCVAALARPHAADLTRLPAGHAEQSPQRLLQTGLSLLEELAARLSEPPACLGVTGQMHGVLLADATLAPLTPLITWQDRRSLERDASGHSALDEFTMRCDPAAIDRTGCRPAAGYAAVTLFALRRSKSVPAAARQALIFADWAAATLTGSEPRTDRTNAASTGGYDVERDGWSELLDTTGLPRDWFPPIAAGGSRLGGLRSEFARQTGLPAGLTVGVAIGDHQAAVLGSLPAGERAVQVNIGTGGQVSLPIEQFVNAAGCDTRPLPDGRFLLVGAGQVGGDALAWLRRTAAGWLAAFGVEPTEEHLFATLLALAAAVPAGADGLRCEPVFRGTRREPHRRGCFTGVGTENFTLGHQARAIIEGIAAELAAVVHGQVTAGTVAKDWSRLIATGNAVRRNPLLTAALADAFGLPVFVPEHTEEAACGAALLAGVQAGLWPDLATAGQRLRLRRV